MKPNPITAFIVTTLLAGMTTAAANPQTPLTAHQSSTAGLTWLTDLPSAQTRAKAEKKSVLLFFHGSDWCPACVEMQRQVFDSPAFAKFARQSLVLVDVDFPNKHKPDEELRRANAALKARFNLSPVPDEGFPTIVLLNDDGQTVFQETGYAGGGPAEVLPKLQRHAGNGTPPAASATCKNLSVEEFARMAADKQNVILLAIDEGLKESEELMGRWLDDRVNFAPALGHVLIGPLRAALYDYLKTVTFWVRPDQLAALTLGAQYRNAPDDPPPTVATFSSGCGQLAAFPDLSVPQAQIGSTDLAMRQWLPADVMAYTMTKPLFEQVCLFDEGSYLNKPFLNRLKKARGGAL